MQIHLQFYNVGLRLAVYAIACVVVLMAALVIVAPVLAQDDLMPVGTEAVVVVDEDAVVVLPDATLEDFEKVAADQFDTAVVKIIQSSDLKTVAMFAVFAIVAGASLFFLYRSSPPAKQLAFVEDAQPRVAAWRDAMRTRQDDAQRTDTPYDDMAFAGGTALLNEVARRLQSIEEQLRSQNDGVQAVDGVGVVIEGTITMEDDNEPVG